jgi:uncharacterized membrane protein YidH (DUF202 family)
MGDTSHGANATYDAFRNYVYGTYLLRERLLPKAARHLAKTRLPFLGPIFDIYPDFTIGWTFRLLGISESVTAATPTETAAFKAVADDNDRDNPAFQHVVSLYWLEDLAAESCKRYAPTVAKVAALRDVFAIRERPSRLEQLSSFQRTLVGAAVVIGVLSAVIPKDAFEVFKGGDNAYDWIRAVIAAGVIALALYVGILAVPWTKQERAARRRRKAAPLISTVLSYCAVHVAVAAADEVFDTIEDVASGAEP